ncbi:MAG: peptidylprolyl isomerase [Flavobacteriaceae bacterium]|nr:peptidylprolyl isomerase [Flavobacteriaceae bacterium]
MKKIILVIIVMSVVSCSSSRFNQKWTKKQSPEQFTARFETTQGDFDIMTKKEWSPNGVNRLYQLIKSEFYTDIALFRVIPKFVVQFGIQNDSLLNSSWKRYKITDEPVLQKNDSMAISFARDGVDSRTTQIFINLKNNHHLDTIKFNGVTGFPVIAKITKGMENVHKFYSTNDDVPDQDSIQKYGNDYIRRKYPKVDFIKKAYILK